MGNSPKTLGRFVVVRQQFLVNGWILQAPARYAPPLALGFASFNGPGVSRALWAGGEF
jgi:hypothetical protein